jgi:DNA-directed RNA polymerase subunit RPC12/RpoP
MRRLHVPGVASRALALILFAMPHVIHLRCDRCGAPTDATGAVWIRCTSCGAIAGYDFTSYAESPEMAEFTRRNFEDPTGYVERWKKHEAELLRAEKLHRKSPAEALEIAAEQAEFVLAETPWIVPPAVKTDDKLRRGYKRWLGFELLHYRLPGRIKQLYGRLNEAATAIGFGANENPLPAFEKMLATLRELLEARVEAGSPPDPDGLSLDARLRLQASQMVAAYIRMVSPELQLDLLRSIYGKDAVETKAIGGQDYSVFWDWQCAQCGLFSPQHNTTDKMTCPGCYAERRFDFDAAALDPVSVVCHGCGWRLDLAHSQMLAACPYCASQVKRYVRAGDPYRAVMADLRKKEVEKHGGSYAQMMAEGNGFGVTPATRRQRLVDGLVRIAQWYSKFITPARYGGFARASLPGASPQEVLALLRDAEAQALRESAEAHGYFTHPAHAENLRHADASCDFIRKAIERMSDSGADR